LTPMPASATPPPARPPNRARPSPVIFVICALLAAVTLAVYWPVTRCEFVSFDDPDYVTRNPQVQAGLTGSSLRWSVTAHPVGNWHPVTWISHMADCAVWGLDPAGHHFTSVLLHAINSVLLFLLLRRMTGALWRSALVAAVFAWHPLRVESVAWVSERKDVLSTFFWMLTIWAYVRYAEKRSRAESREPNAGPETVSLDVRPSTFDYGLALVFFALGLLAKPMLVTLPFLLLLLDYWPLYRTPAVSRVCGRQLRLAPAPAENPAAAASPGQLILEKVPFLALSLVSCVITFRAQSYAVGSLGYSLWHRLGNALLSYFGYLEKLFWPARLAVIYPYPRVLPAGRLAIALLVVGALTFLALRCARTRRYLFTGWFWYLGTLVPVIGLVQVGDQAMADRYSYVPLIGVMLLLVWGGYDLVKSSRAGIQALGSLAVVALVACLPLTRAQLRSWQNSVALFEHALRVTADNDAAEYNLGLLYFERGAWDAAREHFSVAAGLSPRRTEARHALALTLIEQGVEGDAIDRLAVELQQATNHWEGHHRLGLVLANEGKHREAIVQYREAIKLAPPKPEVLEALAWLLATHPDPAIRNGAEAVALAEQACRLTNFQAPQMLLTLAVAYAEVGRFEEAAATVRKAETQATAANNAELMEKCRKLTERFAARQPVHEPEVTKSPEQKQR
jgi:protein O-mannosyl-transferase